MGNYLTRKKTSNVANNSSISYLPQFKNIWPIKTKNNLDLHSNTDIVPYCELNPPTPITSI